MNREEIKENDRKYIVNMYDRSDLVFEAAKGSTVIDKNGRNYIDFAAGIGCASLGYNEPDWVAVVEDQLEKFQHTSNLFYHEPGVRLAKRLVEKTGYSKVLFVNSGSEANEAAMKMARKYGNRESGNRKHVIISLRQSFHGRTMATITATGQDRFHHDFDPFLQGSVYVDAGDTEALERAIEENECCAVIMEFVQGEGGVITLDKDFVRKVAELCQANDMALIADEVQTGVGRTGTFFAYEQFGVKPDLVTFAKGIAGGIPMGGVLCDEKYADVFGPGDHGSTFGMNPIACAGANYVVEKMDDDFLAEVREKAEYLRAGLLKMKRVKGLSGLGMMIGVNVNGMTPAEASAKLLEAGVITITAGSRVRLLPPLNISYEEIDRGLSRMAEVLDK